MSLPPNSRAILIRGAIIEALSHDIQRCNYDNARAKIDLETDAHGNIIDWYGVYPNNTVARLGTV